MSNNTSNKTSEKGPVLQSKDEIVKQQIFAEHRAQENEQVKSSKDKAEGFSVNFTPPNAKEEQSFRDKLMADTKKDDKEKVDKSPNERIIHLDHLNIDDKPHDLGHIDKVVEVPLEDGDIMIEELMPMAPGTMIFQESPLSPMPDFGQITDEDLDRPDGDFIEEKVMANGEHVKKTVHKGPGFETIEIETEGGMEPIGEQFHMSGPDDLIPLGPMS